MSFSADDWSAILLTLQLASATTAILLLLGTPLAWWLARTRGTAGAIVGVVATLPLVLPPTVLGFYLLLMGEQGPIGRLTHALGWGLLPFSFSGLLIASILYSLPFAVQPMQQAFKAIGPRPLEVAVTLRDEASVILDATVQHIDPHYQLARLAFAGGELWLPAGNLASGDSTQVRIHARDISVTLAPHDDSSILNRLPATVESFSSSNAGNLLLRCRCGDTPIIAHITLRSFDTQALAAGTPLRLQIKAVSLI